MDLQNERKLAARAKALGETADASVLPELARLIVSESALIRRFGRLPRPKGIVEELYKKKIARKTRKSAQPSSPRL